MQNTVADRSKGILVNSTKSMKDAIFDSKHEGNEFSEVCITQNGDIKFVDMKEKVFLFIGYVLFILFTSCVVCSSVSVFQHVILSMFLFVSQFMYVRREDDIVTTFNDCEILERGVQLSVIYNSQKESINECRSGRSRHSKFVYFNCVIRYREPSRITLKQLKRLLQMTSRPPKSFN